MPLEQANDNQRGGYKVWFDLSILIVAHISLLPLWLVLWTVIPILIWLDDRGPIFFKQRRAGKDGKIITILKFRTMRPDADRTGPAWTTEGDPRITRMGRRGENATKRTAEYLRVAPYSINGTGRECRSSPKRP